MPVHFGGYAPAFTTKVVLDEQTAAPRSSPAAHSDNCSHRWYSAGDCLVCISVTIGRSNMLWMSVGVCVIGTLSTGATRPQVLDTQRARFLTFPHSIQMPCRRISIVLHWVVICLIIPEGYLNGGRGLTFLPDTVDHKIWMLKTTPYLSH